MPSRLHSSFGCTVYLAQVLICIPIHLVGGMAHMNDSREDCVCVILPRPGGASSIQHWLPSSEFCEGYLHVC